MTKFASYPRVSCSVKDRSKILKNRPKKASNDDLYKRFTGVQGTLNGYVYIYISPIGIGDDDDDDDDDGSGDGQNMKLCNEKYQALSKCQ